MRFRGLPSIGEARMKNRHAEVQRKTRETDIRIHLDLDGTGNAEIDTTIPFFDHMLSLFCLHGFFDMTVKAFGDTGVDYHHTVEDVGLVLGDVLKDCLADRKGIRRFGNAVTPMDDALSTVAVDLSNRPFLVFQIDAGAASKGGFDFSLAKEFFRALATRGGMNLHIHVPYGENDHHILEAIFKGAGRALRNAVSFDDRVRNVRSTKGRL